MMALDERKEGRAEMLCLAVHTDAGGHVCLRALRYP